MDASKRAQWEGGSTATKKLWFRKCHWSRGMFQMTERVKSDIYIEGPRGSWKLLTVPSYWHYHLVLKLLERLQSKSYIQYPGTRTTRQLRTSSIDLLKSRWCITTLSFSWRCLAWQTWNTLRFKGLWSVAQKPKLSHVSCSKLLVSLLV